MRARDFAARAANATKSAENAIHTVLYPRGVGGYVEASKDDSNLLTKQQHRKMRLQSVADPFRYSEEFFWSEHQLMNKKALHGTGAKLVNAELAQHATQRLARQHGQEWERRMDLLKGAGLGRLAGNVTSEESFAGSVPSKVHAPPRDPDPHAHVSPTRACPARTMSLPLPAGGRVQGVLA